MTFIPTQRRSRQVLAFLADGGSITSETGAATVAIGQGVGISTNYASNIVKALFDNGYVERHVIGKRTFLITITEKGRRYLSTEVAAIRRQSERRRRPTSKAMAKAMAPPMPMCGPIGHLDFDPDATRDRLYEGVKG